MQFLHNLSNGISRRSLIKEIYINFINNYEYLTPCKVCIIYYEIIKNNRIDIKKLNKRYLKYTKCIIMLIR